MATKVAKQATLLLKPSQSNATSYAMKGIKKQAVLGKRSFGESVVNIVQKSEPHWANWKRETCFSFEIRKKNERVCQKLKDRREKKA